MNKLRTVQWEDFGLQMAEVLKALGDINRMKIIRVLASNPDESICVSGLVEMIGVTQPAVSQHIKVLKSVGILVPRRVENKTYYSINAEQLRTYQAQIHDMFKRAFVRCTFAGSCTDCPNTGKCN